MRAQLILRHPGSIRRQRQGGAVGGTCTERQTNVLPIMTTSFQETGWEARAMSLDAHREKTGCRAVLPASVGQPRGSPALQAGQPPSHWGRACSRQHLLPSHCLSVMVLRAVGPASSGNSPQRPTSSPHPEPSRSETQCGAQNSVLHQHPTASEP